MLIKAFFLAIFNLLFRMASDGLTSSPVFGVLYELVPEAGRAAGALLLAALEPFYDRPLVVHGHVVLLRVVLQRQRHRHPLLLIQYGEFVPSIVP